MREPPVNPLWRPPLSTILNLYIEGRLAAELGCLVRSHCKVHHSGRERETGSGSADGLSKNERQPPSVRARNPVLRNLRIKFLRRKWEGSILEWKVLSGRCWKMSWWNPRAYSIRSGWQVDVTCRGDTLWHASPCC